MCQKISILVTFNPSTNNNLLLYILQFKINKQEKETYE